MRTQVVVSGGNIGEMAMHFIEKYGLMAVRIPSKFDLRRFCRATGAVALVKLQTPQPDELGFAKQVRLARGCVRRCVLAARQAAVQVQGYLGAWAAAHLHPYTRTAVAMTLRSVYALCRLRCRRLAATTASCCSRTLPLAGACAVLGAKQPCDQPAAHVAHTWRHDA
jgi:hypothetical protein